MGKTGIVYSDIFLQHKTAEGHPERPQRLTAIMKQLQSAGLIEELVAIDPRTAETESIEAVHDRKYIERAKSACENGDRYLDTMDVSISQESYKAAARAAGGVLDAIDAVMEARIDNAFCAVRPPGHHALAEKAMGFCIFNNVAIGAKYIQKKYALEKVLIVDWDVHHGNGTQATFYDDAGVMYFSTHQYPFYPGTGAENERGTGPGVGYTINVPLASFSGDREHIEAFKRQLDPQARAFSPDFILISAGFDSHHNDLLGSMKVTEAGFAKLTHIVKEIAEKCCNGRVVASLEGGYHLEALAASVEAHIRVLME